MAIIPKGQEPANVKKRIDTLFPKLDGAYPDKVIISLQRDHKKWDETAREISKQLGYENKNDFLIAYGYEIKRSQEKGGRPSDDHMAIINELKKRYPNGSPFAKIDELKAANSDLAPKFKTLSNRATELFGMTFTKYLISEGILTKYITKAEIKEENKETIYILVRICDTQIEKYYISPTKSIYEREIVEVPFNQELKFAEIISIESLKSNDISEDQINAPSFVRKVGKREYDEFIFNSTHSVKEIIPVQNILPKGTTNVVLESSNLFIPWALIRGSKENILSVFNYLSKKESGYDEKVYYENTINYISDNTLEMIIYCEDVQDIITHFPNIKASFFVEDLVENNVYFGYSKLETSIISNFEYVGKCDMSNNYRWTILYSPAEDFELEMKESTYYKFPMKDDWELLFDEEEI